MPGLGDTPISCPNDMDVAPVKRLSVSLRHSHENHHEVFAAENILDNDHSLLGSRETIEETHHFGSTAVGTGARVTTWNMPYDI